ncbi:MAG: proton-conducting transporter membrane subunit [Gammaproteobacteria bacterium]|nr:proton-conducting transporter membrane subunit [Gammaproteobacteria bacterium]
MSWLAEHLELAILIPMLGGLCILVFRNRPKLRETSSILAGALLFLYVTRLLDSDTERTGARTLLEISEGLSIAFHLEPLGLVFALLASGLWVITTVYSIGYLNGNAEKNQTRFYLYFALSIASTMGIAFAANLFTLFIFYETLTLCTYPLVTHKQTPEAQNGGRVYLGVLLGTSIMFFLSALVITWIHTGTLEFTPGGILEGKIEGIVPALLFTLFMLGIGKAALMPFHRWLPAAMVAPTPVSALLHAVAVVKAGVFTVLKVTVYIFGIDFIATQDAATWVLWLAVITMLTTSVIALSKDNLKARLAYSTISQLAYIVIGASLAWPVAALGGALHMVTHAFGKITLFFCAGAIYTAVKFTRVSQFDGLGRKMPFTFMAFLLAAFSVIGLPPFVGSWSKWLLVEGSASTEHYFVLAAFGVSTLLNCAYLLPVALRAFFRPPGPDVTAAGPGIREAPLACLVPLCATAIATLLLFFYIQPLYEFLYPVFDP